MDVKKIILFGSRGLYIPGTFAITVKTDNAGTSNDDQFTLTGGESLGNADYRIDWYEKSDPTVTGTITDATGAQTITFPEAGTYVVQVHAPFNRIVFANGGDKGKLLEINQWGSIAWTSMSNAFYGCSNMDGTFTDTPDLSNMTNMFRMFRGASSFNQDIGGWNTGNVTDMSVMFFDASAFNQDIGGWNTGNVEDMASMFGGASSFNQPIGGWNTGNVENMINMFGGASSFNQDIGGWNTGNANNMERMFQGASSFNQNIGGWDITGITVPNSMDNMLDNSGLSLENYNRTLTGFANTVHANAGVPANVALGATGMTYDATVYGDIVGEFNNAVDGRNYLTSASPDPAWTISGDSLV